MKNSYRFVNKIACVLASFFAMGSLHALEPIPNFYQEPGLSPNRDYINQSLNEHIDPFTGKLQLHYTDLHIPGNGGLDISIQRSYNSQDELLREPTALGVGWTMHYGRVLRKSIIAICAPNTSATNAPVLELPDGSRHILYLSDDTSYVMSISRWKGVCAPGGLGLNIFSPDGTVYEMTTPGIPVGASPTQLQASYYTTRVVDRNGNTLNFTYVSAVDKTSVSQITSSDGRVVNFSYTGNVLTSITDGSRVWKYEYDTSDPYAGTSFPFLTKVTRPDSATWEYAYNMTPSSSAGVYSMKQMKYPTGGLIDYIYGFVQFNSSLPKTTVVSKKVGVGGIWTYSYNPATLRSIFMSGVYHFTSDLMFDITHVYPPDGSMHTYKFVGANSVGNGAVYAIGLPLTRSNGPEDESYNYLPQKISSMLNLRPGTFAQFDTGIYAPLRTTANIVRNGQIFNTTYSNFDQYGNAQSIVENGTDSRTTNVIYENFPGKWILHNPKSETIDTIGTTSWTYDPANANLLSETKYGVTTDFTYTPAGDIFTKKDARGNVVTYNSYFRGSPGIENHPEGVTINRSVSNEGNVLSQTDGENVTTSYSYDGLNRLTSITQPVGNPVLISWSPLYRVVTRGAYSETTNFDSYGRVSSTTLAGGSAGPIIQTNTYDPMNRKIFASYPNSSIGTYFQYDFLGRPYAVSHEATPGGSYTGGKATKYFSYNAVIHVNERGVSTPTYFRNYGSPDARDLMQVLAPESSASVLMTRNGLGQVLSVSQGGVARSNSYDSHYFPATSTNPESGTTIFGVDQVGNVISKQVGGASATAYGYDGRNRLTTITYPLGTPSAVKAYYKDDTIKSINNGLVQRSYTYTANKKLKREDMAVDSRSFFVDYSYDGNDALASLTYSTGLSLSYAPDGLGRPTQALPFATSVDFFENGSPKQIAYANGVTNTFALTARQWPGNVKMRNAGGTSFLDMTYVYDKIGNVSSITESVAGAQNRTFGYDLIDRLTNVATPNVTGGTITYDGAGNIKSKQLGSFNLNYVYDSTNKLATVAGSNNMIFNYDAYGNVTGNSKNQFIYNDALQLRCVDCGTFNQIDYVYDGAGTRVKQQTPTLTTYFMYGSGGDLLFDVDSDGKKREYGYVAGRNIAKKESN